MTAHEIVGIVVGLTSFIVGNAVGRWSARQRQRTLAKWVTLPSGVSYETADGLVGFVTRESDGRVHWWVVRRGRTIIEGPAKTLDEGKREAARSVREFGRG